MNEFKNYLKGFLKGKVELSQVESELVSVISRHPETAQTIARAIDELHRARRLAPEAHAVLMRHLGGNTEVSGDEEKTQFTGTSRHDADKTRVTTGHRAGSAAQAASTDDNDRTRVRTTTQTGSNPTGSGAPDTTGASGSRPNTHTGPDTGNSTGTGRTSGTESGWGDPSDWASNSEGPLKPGSVLKGRFVLEAVVGQGGMGIVFKARDLRKEEAQDRNPFVAVKVLSEDFKEHPESLKALQRESRKAQDLAHPNIVTVFDFDRDGGNVYMTMEFLDGSPLDQIVKANVGQGVTPEEAFPIVEGIGHALSYAHKKGIVHSDLKPGNAFLTKDNIVKVFDFGIARAAKHTGPDQGETTLFDAGTLGALTPAYASLEMLEGVDPDPRDDIYALACIAYELLAGKHPFNKVAANKARDKGLTPAPIKNLSRGQWKGLLQGLAFDRNARSPSVDAFLASLRPSKYKKAIVAASAVGAVLLIGVGVATVPDYLHARRIENLIETFKTGEASEISEALAELSALGADDQEQVAQEAKDEILAYFESQVEALVNTAENRYDFPKAQEMIASARIFYRDSAKVESLHQRTEKRKNQLLNELTSKFNEHLEAGRLVSRNGEESISEVLQIIEEIQPGHALLTDPRLTTAYSKGAEEAFAAKDLAFADKLVAMGLEKFPEEVELINLRDKIRAEQEKELRKQRIAELTEKLSVVRPRLQSLADFQENRDDIDELRKLDPENALLGKLQQDARKFIENEVEAKMQARDWDGALALLGDNASLIDAEGARKSREKILAAQEKHHKQIDALFAALTEAVDAGRLASPAKKNAMEILGQLENVGADEGQIQQARARIAQAYLQGARQARAEQNWDEARKLVQLGLKLESGGAVAESLQKETDEIAKAEQQQQSMLAEAERERIEKERQQQIASLHSRFNKGLNESDFSADTASELLSVLDELASVNPADKLVSEGRKQIASQFSKKAVQLADAGDYDQAISVTKDAIKLIPESQDLPRQLMQFERTKQQQLALNNQKLIQETRTRLSELLAQPLFTDEWETELATRLEALKTLFPSDSDYAKGIRLQVADIYLKRAQEMRENKRFAEGLSLIGKGREFTSNSEAFDAEEQRLTQAQNEFEGERREKAKLAEIEGLKQTLLTQTKANDVRSAKNSLAKLKRLVDADDIFVIETAPQALGDAYHRLATGLAGRGQYVNAMALVDSGLAISPHHVGLLKIKEQYAHEAGVEQVRSSLLNDNKIDVPALKKQLAAIKAEDGEGYSKLEDELVAAVRQRIEQFSSAEIGAAKGILDAARQLFPNNDALANATLVRGATKVSIRDVVDRCKPSLAGYGQRSRGTCYDDLPGGARGPTLVVVPAGGGFSSGFAISKYEISVADYNAYCKASKKCKGVGGDPAFPVTNVSYGELKQYVGWLSQVTGFKYRIPTDKEWKYAADARGRQPSKDFNCLLRLGDQVLKGYSLVSVKQGKANGWGLVNYVGNAQELVKKGKGFSANGGAYKDSMSNCDVSLSKQHDGSADGLTGIRLVRELSGVKS